jgi:hypothetical protein
MTPFEVPRMGFDDPASFLLLPIPVLPARFWPRLSLFRQHQNS